MSNVNPAPAESRAVNPKLDYISQCFSAVHTKQTLALDCNLSGVRDSDSVPVYTLHNQFSRFSLGLIDNSGNTRQIMRANIRAKEVPGLLDKCRNMQKKLFDWQFEQSEMPEVQAPPAYTVAIRAGEMKGKTPAEILLADPTKTGELTRHKNWLAGFLSTYPRNKEVIDAIDNALQLLSAGELTPLEISTGRIAKVWEKDFKRMSNGPGNLYTIAKILIFCEFGSDNPWGFRIENCEAPLGPDGKPNMDKSVNRRYGTMRLNDDEMSEFLDTIGSRKLLFEGEEYSTAKKFVEQNNWRARQEK